MSSRLIVRLKLASYSIAILLAMTLVASKVAGAQTLYCNPPSCATYTFTIPILNTAGTSIGTFEGGVGAITPTQTYCKGVLQTTTVYTFQGYDLNGTFEGNTFQGGGNLVGPPHGSVNVNYYTYSSSPPAGCPATGFAATNIVFGSSNYFAINGVQANPENYGGEVSGVTSYMENE